VNECAINKETKNANNDLSSVSLEARDDSSGAFFGADTNSRKATARSSASCERDIFLPLV